MAACLGQQLANMGFFKDIDTNLALKRQMIAVAVAAGVVANFGAPFGGVMWALEMTSTYYMVSNMWKCLFVGISGVITYKAIGMLNVVRPYSQTHFDHF